MKYLPLALLLLIAPACAEEKSAPTLTQQQAQVLLTVLGSATLSIHGADLPYYLDALRALAEVAKKQ